MTAPTNGTGPDGTGAALKSAVLSTDSAFRATLRDAFARAGLPASVALEITTGFGQLGDEQLSSLRQVQPDLIVLDLESDPGLGLKFAQFMADQNPALRFVAVGPVLEPDMLMAAMRANVADYLPKPVAEEQLRNAIERAAQRLGKGAGDRSKSPGVIYPFFGVKGGVGSTIIAANFAIMLHRLTGKKTLLLDLDLELGESALVLGVQPRFNLVDFVENFRRMDAGLLASYIEQHDSGVHLLSAAFQPQKAEAITPDQVRRILQFLRQHYEYIVIDTPKSFGPHALAALELGELVFLVATADLPSLRNIQRGIPLLKRVLPHGEEQLRLIVNRHSDNDAISIGDVERTLGLDVFATIGNDYEAVMTSVNSGKPIALEGNTVFTRDLRALGTKLAGLTTDAPKSGLTGRLGRLLGKKGARP
jgi:pilus assembly protein CpaE